MKKISSIQIRGDARPHHEIRERESHTTSGEYQEYDVKLSTNKISISHNKKLKEVLVNLQSRQGHVST